MSKEIIQKSAVLVIIPKKRDLLECSNYRTVALLNHMGKVLQERLKAQTDTYIKDEQAGFRKDINTIQQILILSTVVWDRNKQGAQKGISF